MYIYLGIFASLLGLGISLYLLAGQLRKKPLVCPRDHPCDRVIGSRFGKTFGIPNSLLGVLFYLVIAALYIALALAPSIATPEYLLIISIGAAVGALFSAYLISIQAFVLRAWCLWCLGSTLASMLLVIASVGLVR